MLSCQIQLGQRRGPAGVQRLADRRRALAQNKGHEVQFRTYIIEEGPCNIFKTVFLQKRADGLAEGGQRPVGHWRVAGEAAAAQWERPSLPR